MRVSIAAVAMAAVLAAPIASMAATVDPTLIPDGTYTVKVEKVPDPAHVVVALNNGMETTLTATGSVNFANVKPNQTLKVSIIKGKVPVYLVQGG